jgi:cytochrome c-type biogenesis protein CcmH
MMGEPAGAPLTGDELEERTDEISGIMRCPVCQGLSVADSPTATALAMKAEVRRFLAQGYSRDQILRYFEQSYGEFIRLEPKPEGFNLVVWAAPIAGLLVGAALVAHRLRGQRGQPAAADSAKEEDPELAAYREKVHREVSS